MAATAGQPNPWLPYAWLRLLDRELTELAASRAEYLRTGKESGTHFLAVAVPNRHGKSKMGSLYFPAWWLGTFPNDWVILTGHKAQLVEGFSEEIRNLIRDKGRRLFPAVPDLAVSTGSSAKDYWRLAPPYQGGLIATGVGSPPTGAGGNCIIIDDPIRSDAEAYSQTYRDNLWRWWQYSIRNRLEPGGVIVLIMSRWVPDDLMGHLLQLQEAAGPAADYEFNDRWRVLRLPALAEAQLPGEPPDPLGRKEGEALLPERYPREKLLALRDGPSGMGPLAFAALFQNNPQPVEGEKFLMSKWAFVDRGEVPRDVRLLRCWDLAATEKKQGNDPDWTVGVLMGRDREGYIYVLDVIRVREDDPSGLIRNTAELDWQWFGRKVRVRIAQDPAQSGKVVAAFYRKLLIGFEYTAELETGDPVARAMPLASYQRGGNVRLLREAPWVPDFVEEARRFPRGHDDQIAAAANAFADLCGLERTDARVLL